MIISFICSILINTLAFNSQPEFIVENEYDYIADFFTIDPIGNIYLVKNSGLIKIDTETNQKTTYSNLLLGNIASVDVSDPFRILVFHRDFNKIVFLDKSLSEIVSPISLDKLDYYNVSAVCQSNNGGFWIFDQSLNQLVYFDKNLIKQKTSSQISLILDENIELTQAFMLEKNDYIYLGIIGEGVLLFDNYGTYIKTFPLSELKSFQVNDGNIVFRRNGEMITYNTNNFTEKSFTLPIEDCLESKLERNKLFLQTKDKVIVYRLNNF